MGFLDVVSRRTVCVLALVSLSATGAQVAPPDQLGQMGQATQQTRPPGLPGTGRTSPDDEDPIARQMNEQLARKRADQRQKQIVDDTAKLVQLAQQLKDGMDKGKINNPGKTAEEIERLAKSVKDKMREGQ